MQRFTRYELLDTTSRTFYVQMPATETVLKHLTLGVPGETALQITQHTAAHLRTLLDHFVRTGMLPVVDVGQ